jgi:hypothetical protein
MRGLAMPAAVVGTVCVSVAACNAQLDQQKLEAAYRSAKEMQALIAGISAAPIPPWTPGLSADAERGGDFEKFNESLQRFSTESSILQDRASTGDERRVAALYAEAVIDYTHSAALWTQKRGAQSFLRGQILYGIDGKPLKDSGLDVLVKTYGLEVRPLEGHDGFSVIAPEGIRKIWATASGKLDEANKIFLGK